MPRGRRFVVRALRMMMGCPGTRLVDSCVAEREHQRRILDNHLVSKVTHIRKNPLILAILRPISGRLILILLKRPLSLPLLPLPRGSPINSSTLSLRMPIPRIPLFFPFPQFSFPLKHIHLTFPLRLAPPTLRTPKPFRRFRVSRVIVVPPVFLTRSPGVTLVSVRRCVWSCGIHRSERFVGRECSTAVGLTVSHGVLGQGRLPSGPSAEGKRAG